MLKPEAEAVSGPKTVPSKITSLARVTKRTAVAGLPWLFQTLFTPRDSSFAHDQK